MTNDIIAQLKEIVGKEWVFTDDATTADYGHDETEDLSFHPHCVVKPVNADEISRIVRLCNIGHIPITPSGARTGLSGGALPVFGGIVLSTERMNKILDIDDRNFQVTVECGVITQVLQEAVLESGLYYPPDPSSCGSCFIGGNIAENAGGAHAVKYGVTKDFVLNLEVVLPDGNIIWTGANTLKNATGYNLTQLFVGSEGTLGIITQAVLRLIPVPAKNMLLLVPFKFASEACEAVSAVFHSGITPSALEFMERDAMDWAVRYTGNTTIDILPDVQACLLIELDGNNMDLIMEEAQKVTEVLGHFDIGDILLAETEQQKATLWQLRRAIGSAVKSNSVYKEEDTVVPRYELPKLLKRIKDIGMQYGFKSVCYGHAGDGNLHVNIVKGNLSNDAWDNELPKAIHEIFEYTVSLKGTLSGEHGIGYVQRGYMEIAFDENQLRLMRGIKKLLDPNDIMNPGKVV